MVVVHAYWGEGGFHYIVAERSNTRRLDTRVEKTLGMYMIEADIVKVDRIRRM